MHKFRELKIWQRSMHLAEDVYKLLILFPQEEKYGLSSQIRRCAISIPSNISEGAGRATNKQFRYFLEIAMGSCNELQTQLELAQRLQFVKEENTEQILDECIQLYKMVLGFYHSLPVE